MHYSVLPVNASLSTGPFIVSFNDILCLIYAYTRKRNTKTLTTKWVTQPLISCGAFMKSTIVCHHEPFLYVCKMRLKIPQGK